MAKRIVFLYPGQGSQQKGMGLAFCESFPEVRETFGQADRLLGFPLSRLCFNGPDEALHTDLNAQLSVYTLSCALTDVLKREGIVPQAASGYSSGFYGAAYAAGCFDFDAGLHIVKGAGEILLKEAEQIDGTMAVIFGLPVDRVEAICRRVEDAAVSITNTPRQVIVSGLRPSVSRVMQMAMEEEALDAYFLPAATAYHSKFMARPALRFLDQLNHQPLHDPRIPVYSYTLLKPVPDQVALKEVMAFQLSHPVWWIDLIRELTQDNTLFVEVGPGAVLSRTIRWIDRTAETLNTATTDALLNVIERCKGLV